MLLIGSSPFSKAVPQGSPQSDLPGFRLTTTVPWAACRFIPAIRGQLLQAAAYA
jgi:hypothetical protein